MNRGLLIKSLRETWLTTLFFAAGLFVFEIMLAIIIPSFEEDVTKILQQLTFIKRILSAFLSAELGEQIGPTALRAFAWIHPIVLALLWGHAISFSTRFPAAEVDRGTIDVLLSLPVKRFTVWMTETAVWIASGVFLIVAAMCGAMIGGLFTESNHLKPGDYLLICTNLLFLYFAVGGLGWLLSSLFSHRGKAGGAAFAVVLASFVINTLSSFSDTVASISFLGILEYYRPLSIIGSGTWPMSDLIVLGSVAVALWTLGAWFVTRRDIHTV